MKKGTIYKTIDDDLVYVNNMGEEYLLTESVSPLGNGTYDLIVAFKLNDNTEPSEWDDTFLDFDLAAAPIWFCGASFVRSFLNGKTDSLIKDCHDYLDKKDEVKA